MIDDVRDQVIDCLEDCHALEQHVGRQLDVFIDETEDQQFLEVFKHHRAETERHEQALRERLKAYNRSPSVLKDTSGIFTAMSRGIIDKVRRPTPATNARDAYAAEHLEIASYHLLEHLASHTGDWATVTVAQQNRADEQAMAEKIAARWEKVVHLSLPKKGVRA